MKAEDGKLGLGSVIAITVSGIVGSGWLFSAYLGAKAAGAGVYLSWTVTLAFFLLMGLALSEIVAMHPVPGLVGCMGAISHNHHFSAIFSFAIWLELVGSMPSEAQASVEYLAHLSPQIATVLMRGGMLTTTGLLVTLGFLVLYWLLNLFGLRFFARVANTIALYKVVVPVVVASIVLAAAFTPGNFTAVQGELVPYGVGSIFVGITTAGMIYAFNGFQLATAFASEIRDPGKTLPRGILLGTVVCFLIYVLLQTAFIGARDEPSFVSEGWRGLNFQSPFVQLTSALGLNFLTMLLYTDACVSPAGTGVTFVGTAARVAHGMAVEKQLPKVFGSTDHTLNLRMPHALNFAVAFVLLFLFRSWASLILFITALIVLMYMVVPLALVGLRRAHPNAPRPSRLPWAVPLCALLLVLQAAITPFIGASDMVALATAASGFMVVFVGVNALRHGRYRWRDVVFVSCPFLVYLWLLALAILLGPAEYGGRGAYGPAPLFGLIALFPVVAFLLFTSKSFVLRCQAMRAADEVPE